jgi:hypothetical protein
MQIVRMLDADILFSLSACAITSSLQELMDALSTEKGGLTDLQTKCLILLVAAFDRVPYIVQVYLQS